MKKTRMVIEKNIGKQSEKKKYDNKKNIKFSIITSTYNTNPGILKKTVKSVETQNYENWELILIDDNSSNIKTRKYLKDTQLQNNKKIFVYFKDSHDGVSITLNEGVKKSHGEYLIFLDHDDVLSKNALRELFLKIKKEEDLDAIYTDHKIINRWGFTIGRAFKPEWSPELLLSCMYPLHLVCVKKTLFNSLNGFRKGLEGAQDYDLFLRISEITDKIGHIPKILYHWRILKNSISQADSTKELALDMGLKALQETLDRRGILARAYHPNWAKKHNLGFYLHEFSQKIFDEKVSIIIQRKNKTTNLRNLLKKLVLKTTYTNYEIIIIEDGETKPIFENDFKKIEKSKKKVKRIKIGKTELLNISKTLNKIINDTSTEYCLILNDELTDFSQGWLTQMMGYLKIRDVEIVGPSIVSSEGLLIHAGLSLDKTGIPYKPFYGLNQENIQYMGLNKILRNVSAISGDCMLFSKKHWKNIGGFDEINFPTIFSDIDFCLKTINKGRRCVFVPTSKITKKTFGTEEKRINKEIELSFKSIWGGERDRYQNFNYIF